MQECNSSRNSRSQTHQDDGAEDEAGDDFALGTKAKHRIDRSAYALKNSQRNLPFTAIVGSDSRKNLCVRVRLLIFRPR
jgi:hypothetical protein